MYCHLHTKHIRVVFQIQLTHSGWKSQKKSHSILRAKRSTFTFWVGKSSWKNAKNGQFWRFFENATFSVIFNHCVHQSLFGHCPSWLHSFQNASCHRSGSDPANVWSGLAVEQNEDYIKLFIWSNTIVEYIRSHQVNSSKH